MHLSRRELLLLGALGATATVFGACASNGGSKFATPTTIGGPTTTRPFVAPPADPSRPWWLQANYAPVTKEVEAHDLVFRYGERADPALAKGLSTHKGALLNVQVAHGLGLPFTDPAALLA